MFTDNNLKWLKEIVESDIKEYPFEVSPYVRLDIAHKLRDNISALLTRLEASERVCAEWAFNANLEYPCSMNALYHEWRKAAGKSL